MKKYRNFPKFLRQIVLAFLVGSFLALFILLTLEQANPMNTKLERDSGIYLYVSSSLLKGGIPYETAWETKPPGIFFINAFALILGKGSRWGIWFIEFLSLSASTILGFILLKKQFRLPSALIGTAIWLLGLNHVLAGGNFTEEYSLPFSFAALLLWVISGNNKNTLWMDFGIGLCTGFAIILRPNNIGVQTAVVLTLIFVAVRTGQYRKLWSRLTVIGIATFIPIFAAGLFFESRGAFNEFLEASLLYNLFYTGGNLDLRNALIGGISNLGYAGGISIIGYFLAIGQTRIQREYSSSNVFLIWIVINGITEVILSGLSGKSFEHYFICWMPLVAVTSAYLVSNIFPGFCLWSEKYPIRLTLALLLIGLLLFPYTPKEYIKTLAQLTYQREKGIQRTDPIAEYINAHTATNDHILIWGGQAGINFLSKRDAPTPYIFYPLFEPSPFTDRIATEYYQALKQRPPTLIVDGSVFDPEKIVPLDEKNPLKWTAEHGIYANPYLVEILSFIRQSYSLKTVISNTSIYQLK